jgi:predicted nucleic acid-binding protein
MKDLAKVLIDTSVWIEFFRKKEPFYSRVLQLLDEDNICCTGIVLAELIQGAKSRKEIKTLKDFKYVFIFLEDSASAWEMAGELSFTLRQSGNQIGLSDCYIAICASKAKVAILTLDNHFKAIKEHLDIALL